MTQFARGFIGGGLDQYTKIMLHFDGTNGSTSFVDFAKPSRVWTARGSGQISTAAAKFGGSSLACGVQAGYIDTPDDADWTLGSGDFTVDCWLNLIADTPAACTLFGTVDTGNNVAAASILANRVPSSGTGKLQFAAVTGSTVNLCASLAAMTPGGGWHHMAGVRSGGSLMLFLDGVIQQTVAISGSVNNPVNRLSIGNNGEFVSTNVIWSGYIDEFRLSVGIARWTANFTPPAAPYA
jgi:Concanavalin A-like lectin/glucanases superfamily